MKFKRGIVSGRAEPEELDGGLGENGREDRGATGWTGRRERTGLKNIDGDRSPCRLRSARVILFSSRNRERKLGIKFRARVSDARVVLSFLLLLPRPRPPWLLIDSPRFRAVVLRGRKVALLVARCNLNKEQGERKETEEDKARVHR